MECNFLRFYSLHMLKWLHQFCTHNLPPFCPPSNGSACAKKGTRRIAWLINQGREHFWATRESRQGNCDKMKLSGQFFANECCLTNLMAFRDFHFVHLRFLSRPHTQVPPPPPTRRTTTIRRIKASDRSAEAHGKGTLWPMLLPLR